jgi:hypothetical protein
MIFSLKRLLSGMKMVILFIIFTYFLYHLLGLVNNWIEPMNRYKEPNGRAVKVFQYERPSMDKGSVDSVDMVERLKFFYWYGE